MARRRIFGNTHDGTDMNDNSLSMMDGAGAMTALGKAEEPATDQHDPETASWAGEHAVNIRLSIPLVFRRFYVTIVAGPERRDRERLEAERARHPVYKLGNIVFLGYSGLIVLLALCAMIIGASALLIGQLFEINLILS